MAFMTLKQMADAYLPMTDDFVVLRLYLSQPEIMDMGVNLLATLLQREIKDLNRWKKKQITEGFYDFSYYYKQYDVDIAGRIELMTRKVIAEVPLTEIEYVWAKENLSGTKPSLFYQPLYQLLKEHGVDFDNPPLKENKHESKENNKEGKPKKKKGHKKNG